MLSIRLTCTADSSNGCGCSHDPSFLDFAPPTSSMRKSLSDGKDWIHTMAGLEHTWHSAMDTWFSMYLQWPCSRFSWLRACNEVFLPYTTFPSAGQPNAMSAAEIIWDRTDSLLLANASATFNVVFRTMLLQQRGTMAYHFQLETRFVADSSLACLIFELNAYWIIISGL
jgi:hypothetical protein